MNKIKYLVLTLGVVAGFGLAVIPVTVGAVSSDQIADTTSVLEDACTSDPNSVLCKSKNDNIMNSIKTIVNTLLYVLGAISVVMIIIGGIRYTTSFGEAKNIEAAKNTIIYAVVGLVVALLAYAIVNFVLATFK